MNQTTQARRDFVLKLVNLKDEAMRLGLYRTGRLLEIPAIEIGWELQAEPTPPVQRRRQKETLTP